MKYIVRNGVFETNSSSTHSVTKKGNGAWNDGRSLPVLDDNKVHIEFGEFGWEFAKYTDPYTKLQYALTMVLQTETHDTLGYTVHNKEEFYETEGFKEINELIKSKCNCDGVEIDSKIEWKDSEYTPGYSYLDYDGYIDHQSSTDDYKSLKDFLNYYDMTLEEFIFHSSVILRTDNDNDPHDDDGTPIYDYDEEGNLIQNDPPKDEE